MNSPYRRRLTRIRRTVATAAVLTFLALLLAGIETLPLRMHSAIASMASA